MTYSGRQVSCLAEMAAILRAGIIGDTGRGNYGHGLDVAYDGTPGVEVVAVADPDPAGREAAARRTGALRQYADYREMLESESVDLVNVCPRWIGRHAEMVIAAAESGARGLMCEKALRSHPGAGRRHARGVQPQRRAGRRGPSPRQRVRAARQEAHRRGRHRPGSLDPLPRQGGPPLRRHGPDGARNAHDGQHEIHGRRRRLLGERPGYAGRP